MERKGKVMQRPRVALPVRLDIPVGRVRRMLRSGHYSERIGCGGPIYLASMMQYLTVSLVRDEYYAIINLKDSQSINLNKLTN